MSINHDPYLYPNSEILKNKYDLQTKEDLEALEGDFTALRLRELAIAPLGGKFDFAHVCAIHEYIFQDIFDWAGKTRTIDIEKPESILSYDSVIYAEVASIKQTVDKISRQMRSYKWETASSQDVIESFSFFYSKLWQVHPFREGNTRTITEFMCEYAQFIKMPFNRELLQENSEYLRIALVAANAHLRGMEDKSNPKYLEEIIADALN